MMNYDDLYALINLKFISIPKYEHSEFLGDLINSEILIDILFYSSANFNEFERAEAQVRFQISLCDLNQTIIEFLEVLQKIKNLESEDSISNLTPFISVDGDPEDLGIWFSFTRSEDLLYIQIDFRTKESLYLKVTSELFEIFVQNFATEILSKFDPSQLPEKLRKNFQEKIEIMRKWKINGK